MSERYSEPHKRWNEWLEQGTSVVEKNHGEQVRLGKLLPISAFAKRTGRSVAEVATDLAERRLFCIDFESVAYVPVFLGDPTLQRSGVGAVVTALADLPSETKSKFFTTPKGSLGGQTPVEALKNGRLTAVLRAAEGFAER
ncbi:hypothetical protein [Methyloversatilis sp.]|uniref:hypothetical protein n=1 Tax=Methyloversatilis sp. TaxID=2569862 RepID=UPI0027337873|nr:hypothetical protein [Methyloversatilis sp.]MDP3457042.1 hypothetical protein [Methyloversatilis sp.]